MASLTGRNNKTEIVSPAGNLEKLKVAVNYGADVVYFGGEQLNLRMKTGNFSHEDIHQGIRYAHSHNARVIFLLNSYLHEDQVDNARQYIKDLSEYNFDGIMVSDPGMIMLLRESGMDIPLHLSTQMSTLNHLSISFWQQMGIERVVLAREVTLDEIKKIRDHTDADIETFIHGALCVSYSGRCLLSRYLSGRDANTGSCSHPCRWRYSLIEEKRPGNHMDIIEHANGTEILSSKDLCLIEKVPAFMQAGVNAFKIEGRMKSLYYTANTTRIYSHAVRTVLDGMDYNKRLGFWKNELDLISHRPYTDDLFNEFGDNAFSGLPYVKKVLFVGYRVTGEEPSQEVVIKVFNPIYKGETIDAIFPITGHEIIDGELTVENIWDQDNNVDMAQPGREYLIGFDRPVNPHAILRRRLQDNGSTT